MKGVMIDLHNYHDEMNQFSTSNFENELTLNREKNLNFEITPP